MSSALMALVLESVVKMVATRRFPLTASKNSHSSFRYGGVNLWLSGYRRPFRTCGNDESRLSCQMVDHSLQCRTRLVSDELGQEEEGFQTQYTTLRVGGRRMKISN